MKDLQPITFPGVEAKRPLVIAGPCSAESEQQVMETAAGLSKIGVKILRAGIWKPRTKPGGFEGVGIPGLLWLRKAADAYGMYAATEVANRHHAIAALEAGIDVIWIGARTSANPFAMQEISDVLRERAADVTVIVKNPINPDLELWIGALQRIYNSGVRRIGAIHRGFSTYGKHLYRNPPKWYIPIELRRRLPNLPLICDPSHIGGKRELVAPLCQQALDMGFDGLIIESHCNPECALSDAAQQVTPEVLGLILDSLVVRDTTRTTESLSALRQQIDRLDNELMEVLNKRMGVSRSIGQYKKEHNMPVLQTGRYDDILNTRIAQAEELGMSADFMEKVLSAIHEESVRQQIEIVSKPDNG